MFALPCIVMFCLASVLVDAFMDDGAIPIAKGFGEDPDVLCDVTMLQVSYMHWFHGPSMSGCCELPSHRCRDRSAQVSSCLSQGESADEFVKVWPLLPAHRRSLVGRYTAQRTLHAKYTDKTRTDDENRNLCCTFGDYFVNKIVMLWDSVSDILCLIVICICWQWFVIHPSPWLCAWHVAVLT